jgi:hypothetical protein
MASASGSSFPYLGTSRSRWERIPSASSQSLARHSARSSRERSFSSKTAFSIAVRLSTTFAKPISWTPVEL